MAYNKCGHHHCLPQPHLVSKDSAFALYFRCGPSDAHLAGEFVEEEAVLGAGGDLILAPQRVDFLLVGPDLREAFLPQHPGEGECLVVVEIGGEVVLREEGIDVFFMEFDQLGKLVPLHFGVDLYYFLLHSVFAFLVRFFLQHTLPLGVRFSHHILDGFLDRLVVRICALLYQLILSLLLQLPLLLFFALIVLLEVEDIN